MDAQIAIAHQPEYSRKAEPETRSWAIRSSRTMGWVLTWIRLTRRIRTTVATAMLAQTTGKTFPSSRRRRRTRLRLRFKELSIALRARNSELSFSPTPLAILQ